MKRNAGHFGFFDPGMRFHLLLNNARDNMVESGARFHLRKVEYFLPIDVVASFDRNGLDLQQCLERRASIFHTDHDAPCQEHRTDDHASPSSQGLSSGCLPPLGFPPRSLSLRILPLIFSWLHGRRSPLSSQESHDTHSFGTTCAKRFARSSADCRIRSTKASYVIPT